MLFVTRYIIPGRCWDKGRFQDQEGPRRESEATVSMFRETGAEIHSYGGGGRRIMRFEDASLIRSSVEITLGQGRDKVGNMAKATRWKEKERRLITVMGKRLCRWPLPAALVPRLGEETLRRLGHGLRHTLSHSRQNSIEDFQGIPPALYRRCCSSRALICRAEAPGYTSESIAWDFQALAVVLG